MLSAVLIIILFGIFFYNPIFGMITQYMAITTIILGSFLFGITLVSLFADNPSSVYLTLIVLNGEWVIDFKPLYLFLLLGLLLFLMTTINLALQNLNAYPINTNSNHYFESFSIIAIALSISALVLDETITSNLSILLFVLGTLFLLFALIILFYNILHHPLSSVYIRSNTEPLFSHNLIPYILYSNTDMGPSVMFKSENLRKNSVISDAEIFKFGVNTLMLAYNDNKYIENISISPFIAREDYFALSLSFIAKDSQLQDDRFKDRTQCALVLLIPEYILTMFVKPLRNISLIPEIISEYGLNEMDITDINDDEFLSSICKRVMTVLL